MKKIKYLLFIFAVFLFGTSVSLAKTFTLGGDGEERINDYDYIVGTHVFTFDYINQNDFTTQMLMYAASSLDGSSLDNIKMYMYFGNGSMYDVITFNTETVPLDTTYEITHVNGVCIDPTCLGQTIEVNFNYNDNGITPSVNKTLAYKSLITEPATPSKLGHKFTCWVYEDTDDCFDFSTPVDESNTLDGKLTLEASWEVIDYKVTYVDTVSDKTVDIECNFTAENRCKFLDFDLKFQLAEGYTFNGWALAETGEKVYTSTSNFDALFGEDAEFTLYSIFNSSDYTISYNLNGGTFNTLQAPTTVYDPSVLEYDISTPSKVGYIFKGWNVTEGSATVINNKIVISAVSNIEIEATWAPIKYRMMYNGINLSNSETCEYDKVCALDLSKIVVQDGFEVVSMTANINGVSYDIGTNVKNIISAPINDAEISDIEVNVEVDKIKYSASFDLNGASVANADCYPTTVTYNGVVSICKPFRTGYTFGGWEVTKGKATVTDDTLKITKEADVAVKAKWTPIEYNVVYNNKNLNTSTCVYDKKCNLDFSVIEIPNGKVLSKVEATVGGNKVELGSQVLNLIDTPTATTGASSVAAVAVFENIKYNVNFDLNGALLQGNNSYPVSAELGESLSFAAPTRTGYTFNGWEVTKGQATVTNTSLVLTKNADVAVKAKWTPIKYKLVYNNVTYANCTFDQSCTLSAMKAANYPEGKTFKHWTYNDEVLGDVVYNLSTTAKDITIAPVYENIKYNINYNYNGGIIQNANLVSYDIETSTITLNRPSKVGYNFNRWIIQSTGNKATINGDVISVNRATGPIFVTADFIPVEFEVSYNVDGVTTFVDSHKCDYESCELTDQVPEKSGFIFAGWINEDSGYVYESGSTVQIDTTSDVELTAKWSNKDSYKIKYHLDGGTFAADANTKFFAGEAATLTTPSKVGYTFKGWVTDSTLVSENYISSVPTGVTSDFNVYAKYDAKTYTITFNVEEYLGIQHSVDCKYDATCTFVDLTDEFNALGYKLVGWGKTENVLYYGPNLTVRNLEGGLTNTVLYPILEEIEDDYVISYYLDGGAFVDETEVKRSYNNGESLVLPEVTKFAYEVDKWILDDGTVVDGTETDINRDVVLIPVWKGATTYTVILDNDFDDGVEPITLTCELGVPCELPGDTTFEREYCHFDGWYFANDLGIELFYNIGDDFVFTYDNAIELQSFEVKLVVAWAPDAYNITYVHDSIVPDYYLLDGYAYGDPNIPIPIDIGPNSAGKEFVAWTYNGEIIEACENYPGDNGQYVCLDVTIPLGDVEIVALYKED